VLDRIDPRPYRSLRTFAAVGVSSGLAAQRMRFADKRVNFLLSQLRPVHIVGQGEHAACDVNLNNVRANF
jgi:hypothetical protein